MLRLGTPALQCHQNDVWLSCFRLRHRSFSTFQELKVRDRKQSSRGLSGASQHQFPPVLSLPNQRKKHSVALHNRLRTTCSSFLEKLANVNHQNSAAMSVNIKFTNTLAATDPLKTPVTIIGQLENLKKLSFETIKAKLEPRVTPAVYQYALESLQPSPTDSCSLFLNHASIVSLPLRISRNNAPSRAHYLTKAVKNASNNTNEYIVIVCEKSDVFASACAVAKAFPSYSRKSKKESKDENVVTTVEFLLVSGGGDGDDIRIGEEALSPPELATLEAAAKAIRNAARITDVPCSEMHTNQFIQEAKEIADQLPGVEFTVIQGEELAEKGMGGIYNVGKAAENAPALVVLSHKPAGATKNVAWVGKGIVYDTGGLSIKGKTAMCSMKRDCGGAAGVLNAFDLAVKEGFKQNLYAILCLAENAVGPKSYRPDDIIVMYSKKTVEINNTDAEGRLVLADGVVYAKQDLNADIIVDMATLTGAQGVTTGHYHGAILTNTEEWEALGVHAGKTSGDLLYPIIYAPELHFSEFNSPIADMKNSVADRTNALASCAGLFIGSHLGFDFPGIWLHIDMAYPVEAGGRSTGYGVALLNVLFGRMSSSPILQNLAPEIPTA